MANYGIKVCGISDVNGAIWNDRGLDIHQLKEHVAKTGSIIGFAESEAIAPDELLCQPCDVLAPAALDRVITGENAGKLRCKILAEGANGPTTPEADAILDARGDIFVIPDILCNAGGVTVSYFEWVQNLQRFQWTEREVLSKLETMLQKTFEKVLAFATRHGVSQRVAAQAIAIKTVADAKAQRGMFP
jgi:glutamate dehydrogenase (NAD(P)+)